MTARKAAFAIVQTVLKGANLSQALTEYRDSLADSRDRALVTTIATGTFRWLAALDHIIEQVSRRPPRQLDSEVMNVLRLGVFQLLYLDKVPASAAVNESVHLIRQVGKSSASTFVNAVLRRVAAKPSHLLLPPEPTDADSIETKLDYLSLTCSHPRWLVERWLLRHGLQDTIYRVRFNNSPPALTLRANRLHIRRDDLAELLDKQGVHTRPTEFARDGLVVVSGNPYRIPVALQRLFLAQDEASQLVAELVAPRAGENILDACAAPGGKVTALAATLFSSGLLVAGDIRPRRLKLLQDLTTRLGATKTRFVQLDLRTPAPFPAVFDRVLVDAPCSGLGILRRDPEIRWRRQPPDLKRFAAMQLLITSHAGATVRPGGHLIYATCSGEPDENEEVVSAFLDTHPEFELVPLEQLGSLPIGLRRALDKQGRIATTAATHNLESFFAATLRRRRG